MITAEDVMKLGETFRELTRTHAPIESIRPLFINPGVLIPDGELMTLEAHHAMHGGFKDQFHDWQEMTVTPISEDPERVRAVGLVAWEASFTDGRPGRIRSVRPGSSSDVRTAPCAGFTTGRTRSTLPRVRHRSTHDPQGRPRTQPITRRFCCR
jgi:hypothetical protein